MSTPSAPGAGSYLKFLRKFFLDLKGTWRKRSLLDGIVLRQNIFSIKEYLGLVVLYDSLTSVVLVLLQLIRKIEIRPQLTDTGFV